MKRNPVHRTRASLARLALLSVALPTAAIAQRSVQSAPNDDYEPDATVVLSPFEVNAAADDGYNATHSVSGTRTRTEISNLPLSMQVFTDEFIRDIAATDLIDVVGYASGVSQGAGQATNDDDNTNFTLRGQSSFLPMRNGFRRLRLVPAANIDRVEIIKGPSSLLYGQLNPGGNVNYITKRPQPNRTFGQIRLEAGSYEFMRGVLDANVAVIPKTLSFRFVGSAQGTEAINERYKHRVNLINPSVTWWLRPTTSLTFEYESTTRRSDAPRTNLPFHSTIDFQKRPGAVDRTWNTSTSDDYLDTDLEVYTVELVHTFNRHFTLRANYTDSSWYEERKVNGGAITLQGPNLNLLPRRSLAFAKRGSWDNWTQAELVNNLTLGGIEIQNILGYQYEELQFRTVRSSTQVTPSPTLQWDIFDPSTWILTNLTEADTVPAANTGNRSTNKTHSAYFTNQLSFLDGRLRTLMGLRYDDLKVFSYNKAADTTTIRRSEPAKIPQIGVLFKPRENISLYTTYSESFLPIFSTSRRPDGSFYNPDPQSGVGFDLGVKASFLEGRLAISAAVFQVDNENIVRNLPTVTITHPDGTTETFSPTDQSGVERSEGFEFDARIRPSKRSQLIASYGYTDAYVKSDVQNPVTREGHQLPNAPKHTFAIFWRQDLGDIGPAQGAYFTIGSRYVGERPFTEFWNVSGGVAIRPPDLRAYTLVDVGIGARFKLFDHDYTTSINVKNLFDKEYLSTRYFFGAPRTVTFSLTTRF